MNRKQNPMEAPREYKNVCPQCGCDVPDNLMKCPVCLERQSREVMLRHQKQFIPDVLSGKAMLRMAHLVNQGWHLILIGDPLHAYCGETIGDGWDKKRIAMNVQSPVKVCDICREVFDRLVRETMTEVSGAGA